MGVLALSVNTCESGVPDLSAITWGFRVPALSDDTSEFQLSVSILVEFGVPALSVSTCELEVSALCNNICELGVLALSVVTCELGVPSSSQC